MSDDVDCEICKHTEQKDARVTVEKYWNELQRT